MTVPLKVPHEIDPLHRVFKAIGGNKPFHEASVTPEQGQHLLTSPAFEQIPDILNAWIEAPEDKVILQLLVIFCNLLFFFLQIWFSKNIYYA